MAVEMVQEGLITEREALLHIDADKMDYFIHTTVDPAATKTVLGKGLPASPGAATGSIVFTSNEAEALAANGQIVVLVRHETSPEDIHGMKAAVGILTALGGMTSHAAVVARGMGKCCVCGCADITVNYDDGTLTTRGGKIFRKGTRSRTCSLRG
jgi:pyruvate,orthophosphate dikinase